MKHLPKDALLEDAYQVLRSNTLIWMSIDDSLSDSDPGQIVELAYSKLFAIHEGKRRWTKLKKLFVISSIIFSVTGGSSFAVARLVKTEKPIIVLGGVMCRAAATNPANGVVLPDNLDPIEACRKDWETGSLAMVRKNGPVPPLTACINKQGLIEVFPGLEEVCGEMRLAIAHVELDDFHKTVFVMKKKVIGEVNAVCVSFDTGIRTVKEILRDLKLSDWKLEIGVKSTSEPCSVVAILEEQKLLEISSREDWSNHEKIISR